MPTAPGKQSGDLNRIFSASSQAFFGSESATANLTETMHTRKCECASQKGNLLSAIKPLVGGLFAGYGGQGSSWLVLVETSETLASTRTTVATEKLPKSKAVISPTTLEPLSSALPAKPRPRQLPRVLAPLSKVPQTMRPTKPKQPSTELTRTPA